VESCVGEQRCDRLGALAHGDSRSGIRGDAGNPDECLQVGTYGRKHGRDGRTDRIDGGHDVPHSA
jgi:hypothetical protein